MDEYSNNHYEGGTDYTAGGQDAYTGAENAAGGNGYSNAANGNGGNNYSNYSQGYHNGGDPYQQENGYRSPGGKRLRKSVSNRMVCGVCGGLAEYLNWDPTIVRIAWVAISIIFGAGFMGLLAYFVVAVIMPEQ